VGGRFSEDAMIFSTISPRPVTFATFGQAKVEKICSKSFKGSDSESSSE
jgi:hypothetical protein